MPTTKRMILSAGQTVAGFRVIAPIAAGGMAVVYEAEQISLKRRVALKILNERLGRDDAYRERFIREGMHIASLEHPNIVPVYDAGEEDGRLYIAMRFIDGETLGDLLSERRLSATETTQILTPIARALDAAHDAGIVHRDIKPGNILIDSQGHAFLADFGIARAATATHTLTTAGSFVGSVHYASPEQARGVPPSPASDVYSLSVVYFQCIAGQVPYRSDTESNILDAHLTSPVPTISEAEGGTDQLNSILASGMAKNPAIRFSRASDLADAIADALGTAVPPAAGMYRQPKSSTAGGLASTDETLAPTPPTEVPTPIQTRPTPVKQRSVADDAGSGSQLPGNGTVVIESTTVDPQHDQVPATTSKRRRSIDTQKLLLGAAAATAIALPLSAVLLTREGTSEAVASSGVSIVTDQALIRTSSSAAESIGLNPDSSSVYASEGSQIVIGPYASPPKSEGDLPAELAKSLTGEVKTTRVTADGVPAVRFSAKSDDKQFSAIEGLVLVHRDGKHELISCMNTTGGPASIACDEAMGSISIDENEYAPIAPTVAKAKLLAAAIEPLSKAARTQSLSSGSFDQISKRAKTLAKEADAAADRVKAPKGTSPAEAKQLKALAKLLDSEANALLALSAAAGSSKSSKYSRYDQASKRLHRAQLKVRNAIRALN